MITGRAFVCAAVAGVLASALPAVYGDVSIDVSGATRIALPAGGGGPVAFKTADGKEGWVRRLSSDAIPTPAFAKGKLFTGGGMSSRVFMALNAATGETIWEKPTQDNGPTSPVVEAPFVGYNTESCHTELRDIDSGEMIWSEMTGGSLLTQPLIADNMFIIPHPTMARTSQWSDNSFRMLGVDLKTGNHHWDASMTGDVMGAPVAADGRVFFACTDGRLFAIQTRSGGGGWHAVANATSAPVIVGDTLAVTTEEKRTFGGATVSIRRYSVADGTLLDKEPLASTNVDKAVLAKNQRAEWDYQGPKIAASGKHLFNAPGRTINSVDMDTGKSLWKGTVSGGGMTNAANALTPPALGKSNLYIGSSKGHILAVKQSDGSLVFAYNVAEPLASQPILADGNLYFGTATGNLVCLKLNSADAKDWNAWGGNAQHNKVE